MDQNPPRNGRGRARGSHQPQFSGNQPRFPGNQPRFPGNQPRFPGNQNPRFNGAQSRPPRLLGAAYTPRASPSWPRQPAQVAQQAPRPGNNQESNSQAVENITSGISNLSRGDAPVPLGRGAVRGRRVIDTEVIEYYRMPRPESSKGGKQGSGGTSLDLVTNYFPVKTYTNWTLYQYRINFSPEEDRIAVKRGLLGNHRETLGAFIFDGSMMFSSKMYDSREFTLTSKRSGDDQIVSITVIFVAVLEPNDYAYIQVFNLLLRNCMRHLKLTLVGRNYYDPAAKIDINRYRLQMWPGYETTIGMFDSGLLLRADISTKIMRDESVLDFFGECRRNSNDYLNNFKAGIIGTVVLTRYNNHTYKIDDVDENITPRSTFKMKDGTQMSYVEYYKRKWNIIIREFNQPMLLSKKKKSISKQFNKNEDDDDDLVILVPELCSLTGITEAMRSNPNLMKELANFTRVNPMERINRINNFMRRLQSIPDSIASLRHWNLDLDNNLVKLKGRVLNQQKVYCNNKSYEGGYEANWTRNVRSLPMFTSAVLSKWVILYPQQNEGEVRAFVKTIIQVASSMSFRIPQPEYYPINAGYIGGYTDSLEKIISQWNPAFILCVTQSQRSDVYNLIKRHLCINRAVPSQVVLLKNVSKNNMSVCTKIAIQVNCKLGGAPWKIAIPTPGIMIVGFDVCHDKQNKNRSYGALIASLNDDHTKYYSTVQPHPSGQELSTHFAISMSGALNAYRKLNRKLPEMIIIYRDGVGDGQISHVHKTEVKLVKDALQSFYGEDKEPPMAFIIVKKRISTRFFSTTQGSPPSNPPPGTVVDSVITDPTMYDFFLVSQHVTFGTVTPTHYNVIVDTLPDWNPNKMQLLTYKLTHMYFNWSGTVRVPAQCQLAHKLAFLAAQSLQGTPNVALNELLYFL